jgi:hypothetical protein
MLAALVALAMQAGDADTSIATFGTWKLYSDVKLKQCQAVSYSNHDEYIIIGYDAATKRADITFTNKFATSLGEGDERAVRLIFLRGSQLDDSWGDVNFKTSIEPDGRRMLLSQFLMPPFLDAMAKSRAIGFFYGHNAIAIFSLKDTGKLVPALRDCAMKAAGLDPRDPFAGE